MSASHDADAAVDIEALAVRPAPHLLIGVLRYFEPAGPFAKDIVAVIGGPVPQPLQAARYSAGPTGSQIIVATLSPSETIVITDTSGSFAAIEEHTTARSDGCLVEQTGGIRILILTGARTGDLMRRLGAIEAIPNVGEARTSRVAEVTVTALCVVPGQLMLLVERVYSRHLMNWIRETAADL